REGVAVTSPKLSRCIFAQTGLSVQMRRFETHSPHAFRGLTTPSAPTLVAFGIIFLMARPPLLCKEGNMFLFNIRSTPRVQHELMLRSHIKGADGEAVKQSKK